MAEESARPSRRYDAFVSYSHSADGELAPAIQRGLHRFAKPLMKRRAIEVFRDQTGLSVNASLWTSICEAMDGSEWFVLLASPESAQSEWVGHEIQRWVATKGADRILPVVTEGTWVWDAAVNGFDWERSTAVHPALHGVFSSEPRHLDMTWARGEAQLTLRNGKFRDQIAELAAPIHGRAKDELEGEDVHQQKRTRRMVAGALVALTALTATSITGGGIALVSRRTAIQERDRADQQAREAISRRLAGLATDISGEERAIPYLLAAEAYRKAPTLEAQGALADVAVRATENAVAARYIGNEGGVVDVAVAGDGSSVATIDTVGRVRVYAGDDPADVAVLDGTGTSIVFAGDRLAVGGDAGITWWRNGSRVGSADVTGVVVLGAAPPGSAKGAVSAALEDGSIVVAAPDAKPTTVAPASGVPDPVFVGGAAGGAVVVSNDAGRTRVLGKDGAELASWSGSAAASDVSADGRRVTELVHEAEADGEVPMANVRALDGTVEATITSLEYFRSQAALFMEDGRVAVVTEGGVDGAPPQLFVAPAAGGDAPPVPAELPSGITAVAYGGGRVVSAGATDPVAIGTQLAATDFGADVLPDGWSASSPLSASTDGHVVVRRGEETGLLDVAAGDVAVVPGVSGPASVSPDRRWLLTTDGRVLDRRTDWSPAAADLPVPELGVAPAWSGDGSRVAYVVDSGRPNGELAGASMEDDTEIAAVTIAAGSVATVAPGGAVCRAGCSRHDAALASSTDGRRLLVRVGGTDSSGATTPSTAHLFAIDGTAARAVTSTPALGPAPVAFDAEAGSFLVATRASVLELAPDDLRERGRRVGDPVGDWAFAPGGRRLAGVRVPVSSVAVSDTGCDVALLNTQSWSVDATVARYDGLSEAGCDVTIAVAWIGPDVLLTGDACASDDDCPVRRWDLDPDRLAERACRLAGRNLTRDEWDQFLPGWEYERTCEQFAAPRSGSSERPTTTSAAGGVPSTRPADPGGGPAATEPPVSAAPPTTAGFPATAPVPETGGALFGDLDQGSAAALYGYLRDNQLTFVGPCASAVFRGNDADLCIVRAAANGPDSITVTMGQPQSDYLFDLYLTWSGGTWSVGDSRETGDEYGE